jgi:hypothetical protein
MARVFFWDCSIIAHRPHSIQNSDSYFARFPDIYDIFHI